MQISISKTELQTELIKVCNGDVVMHMCRYEFQMQFGSIGWSVGATLGYSQALKGNKRVIASIGDGSFQVTAQACPLCYCKLEQQDTMNMQSGVIQPLSLERGSSFMYSLGWQHNFVHSSSGYNSPLTEPLGGVT